MANDIFNIDFSDDNGADVLDLSDMLDLGKPNPAEPNEPAPAPPTRPNPTTPKATDNDNLIDLVDSDFIIPATDSLPPTDDPAAPATDTATSSPYSSLATLFHERGVISDIEAFKDVKNIDDFVDKFQERIQDGVLSEMTPEQKQYFEALKAGVPTQWYHDKTSILNQLNKVQETNLLADTDQAKQVRYNLIYNDFVSKGYDSEDAKQLATDQFQLARDKELSKKALANAKSRLQTEIDTEIQTKQSEQNTEIEQQGKLVEQIKEKVYSTSELFPGMKLSKIMQDKIFKTATTIAGYNKANQPLTPVFKALQDDPVETQIKLAYLWALTDGGKNVNTLISKASSKVAKEVEDMIISGSISADVSDARAKVPSTPTSSSMIDSLRRLGIGEIVQP